MPEPSKKTLEKSKNDAVNTPAAEEQLPENPSEEEFMQRMAGILGDVEPGHAASASLEQDLAAIRALEAKNAELEDKVVRTLAEMENLRKRTRKELDDAKKYGPLNLARDMILVAENLHRALESIPQGELEQNPVLKNIFDGVDMTRKELESIFSRHQIERVSPEGEPFNPEFHQALMQTPTGEHPEGTVIGVLHAGYKFKDRLLRPAMVNVASRPAAAEPQAPAEPDSKEAAAE